MALQCLAVLRTVDARAHHYLKHAAHHLFRRHIHRAGHWIAHPIVTPATMRVMVCTLAGLGAIGIGGAAITGTRFHSLPTGQFEGATTPPFSAVPSGPDGPAGAPTPSDPSAVGGLSDPPTPSDPSAVGGLSDPPIPSDPGATGGLSDPPTVAPGEDDDPVDPSFLSDPSAGGSTDPPPDPRDPDFSPDPSGQPTAIPEPASIIVLTMGLLALAVVRRKAIRCASAARSPAVPVADGRGGRQTGQAPSPAEPSRTAPGQPKGRRTARSSPRRAPS
jgi:PEP-CTERM motif